jgi:3',5'-cyclic AMP phosphodiesterase CpdA
VRFSAVGDIGADANASAVLEAVGARGDDFALALGDLSYGRTGEETTWCRFVTDRVTASYPFELVSGNHEEDGDNGDIDAFIECLPNRLPGVVGDYGRQWYVDVPASDPVLRVIMISPALDFGDGEWSYAEGTAHYAWTRDAVETAHDTGVPWVVVGMHKPCLTVGVYECDPGADLMNLLVAEGVDLVLTGHEHMYQRTVPLALGPDCPELRPDEYDAGCLADGDGTTFLTVGTGGRGLRQADLDDPDAPYFAAVSAEDVEPAHGSLAVAVTDRRLVARFEPVGGATFTDAVTIDR